jgi:hypothetical protein
MLMCRLAIEYTCNMCPKYLDTHFHFYFPHFVIYRSQAWIDQSHFGKFLAIYKMLKWLYTQLNIITLLQAQVVHVGQTAMTSCYVHLNMKVQLTLKAFYFHQLYV